MQPSIILPSPSGPFWCRQTFETAEMRPSYLKTATRSPPQATTQARFSGMLVDVADGQISVHRDRRSRVSCRRSTAPPTCAAR